MTWINAKDYSAKRVNRDLYQIDDLSQTQREFLMKLNKTLIKLEKQIQAELNRLHILGKQRVEDHSDWVEDFEIEAYINFILNESDPEFDEDLDNILVQLRESRPDEKRVKPPYLGNEQINHNTFQHWEHPMSNEYHCWLYHCLYDHTDLGWSNILRIGEIWLDVDIEFQTFITV